MRKSDGLYEYTGCVHIHTTASDGTKGIEEIAAIAADLGLDFALIADHMTLKNRHENKEGYFGDTLVLVGYEHNDVDDCHHYLLFESDDVLPADLTAAEYVALGKKQGALGIIAHPDEIRPRHGKYPSFPWNDWNVDGFDGIEIWNQMSEWMEKLGTENNLKMLFSPRSSLTSPTDRILERWDTLNRSRKIAGIASVDAHAFAHKIGPLRIIIFPYKVQFKSLRTHLLLDEPLARELAAAKRQFYQAIRNCRIFVSNYRHGDASGFRFQATRPGQKVTIGGNLEFGPNTTITVRTPRSALIRLIRDGRPVLEAKGDEIEYPADREGLYRVEAYRKKKGWIFSNHIRIGP